MVFMTLSWGRPKAFWHEADSKPGELLPSKTDHIKQLLWLNRFSDLTPFGSIDGGFHGSHGDHTHTHTRRTAPGLGRAVSDHTRPVGEGEDR